MARWLDAVVSARCLGSLVTARRLIGVIVSGWLDGMAGRRRCGSSLSTRRLSWLLSDRLWLWPERLAGLLGRTVVSIRSGRCCVCAGLVRAVRGGRRPGRCGRGCRDGVGWRGLAVPVAVLRGRLRRECGLLRSEETCRLSGAFRYGSTLRRRFLAGRGCLLLPWHLAHRRTRLTVNHGYCRGERVLVVVGPRDISGRHLDSGPDARIAQCRSDKVRRRWRAASCAEFDQHDALRHLARHPSRGGGAPRRVDRAHVRQRSLDRLDRLSDSRVRLVLSAETMRRLDIVFTDDQLVEQRDVGAARCEDLTELTPFRRPQRNSARDQRARDQFTGLIDPRRRRQLPGVAERAVIDPARQRQQHGVQP